jgi:adenylate cyclase
MSRLLKALLYGCLVGIAGLFVSLFHFSHSVEENVELSLLFKLRGPSKPPSDIVIVSIDRESSQHLNISPNPDRWPRSLHAQLLAKLKQAGAEIIVFDVYFVEHRSPEEDASLARAMTRAGKVVLAEPLSVNEVSSSLTTESGATGHKIVEIVKPVAPIAHSAFASAPFVLPRLPVRVNQYWTFQPEAGDSPTFPVMAFQLYTLPVFDDFVHRLKNARPEVAEKLPGDAAIRASAPGGVALIRNIRKIFEADRELAQKMTEGLERSNLSATSPVKHRLLLSLIKMYSGTARRYLNYYGPPRTLTTVPFYKALQLGENSAEKKSLDLKGKVVFVGLSEILLAEKEDSFHTVFSKENGVFISGVEIAATAFANLLEDKPITPIPTRCYLVLILGWGILAGAICRIAATTVAALAVLALSASYLFAAQYQFATHAAWYPIVIPLFLQAPLGFFGAVLFNYFETNRERQNIRNALSYYVPPEVVHQLARNRIDMKRGGETLYGACLFADAAGYTTFSEQFDPRKLRDLMHDYFAATLAPIHQHGGLVVDLKGDSILAVWKAAGPRAPLRKQACLAALGVAEGVARFNQSFADVKLPVRIAVHCGEIFLGNIGAGEHYEYGVTGDTVNTASRLDGLNKHLGTQILVSAEALHEVNGLLTREAGSFLLKGKTQPVVVYELLGRLEASAEKQRQACAIFTDALALFKQHRWNDAKARFHGSIEILGADSLSQFYVKLCQEYLIQPPQGSRGDVIRMDEK